MCCHSRVQILAFRLTRTPILGERFFLDNMDKSLAMQIYVILNYIKKIL